ncbi:MAG: NosD domain-containing protein [Salinigranum sp.]
MSSRGRRAVGLAVLVIAATLAGVGLVAHAWSGTATAARPTKIDGCVTITEPGVYVLTKDVQNGGGGGNFTFISETCIRIAAGDVTLRGGGHLVDGRGISDTTGVGVPASTPVHNVTVENLRVTDWNRGVYLRNTVDSTVRDVHASGNSFGVFVEDSRDATVRGVSARRGFIGLYLGNDSGTRTTNNTFAANHVGDVVRDADPGDVATSNGTRATTNGSG